VSQEIGSDARDPAPRRGEVLFFRPTILGPRWQVYMRFIASLTLALLFVSGALAESGKTGTIVNWEALPYSKSVNITLNHVVYTIHLGDVHYRITRRSPTAEWNIGQQVDCRVEGNNMFVRNAKGKEVKYDIVGVDGGAGSAMR
jgi:hypothetical protein